MGYLLLGFGIGLISAVISGSFLHGLLTYNLVFDETIWVTLMAAFFSLIFIYVVFRFLVSSEKSSREMISHLDFVKLGATIFGDLVFLIFLYAILYSSNQKDYLI
jgi:hypothetical protein